MKRTSISRREFLKGTAAGALGVAAMGMFGLSAGAAEESYIPGTYSATAKGMDQVTVTMTFSETAITDVVVDVSKETPDIGALHGDELAKQLLDTQGAQIDGVSGASITSQAVREAATKCIAQAKGAETPETAADAETEAAAEAEAAAAKLPEALSVKEFEQSEAVYAPIDESKIAETKEYDVVVVGAGAAGVPCALSAFEAGASVAVLQKQPTAFSQGNMGSAINLDKSDAAGIAAWLHDTNERMEQRGDWKQLRAYAANSYEAINWLEERTKEAGVEPVIAESVFTYEDGQTCTTKILQFGPKPKNTGDAMMALSELAASKGVEFFYNTPAVQLVKEDGRVTGVIGKNENGEYVRFLAKKGVILTTGDYQNNDAMVAKYCPDLIKFDKKQVQKTGDGQLIGICAGAVMEPVGHTKMVHDSDSGPMHMEPFFAVNENGERFMNEQVLFENKNDVLRNQPRPGWFSKIFDSNYFEQATEWGGNPADEETLTKYIPGAVENPKGVYESLIDTHKADTLEELAEMLEIPADALVASVKRYNELCAAGLDEDFGKKAKYLKPVEKAPFYGIHKHFRVSAICAGLLVDVNGQCLDSEGNAIPGLFAAGNCSGQFYGGTDYPMHSKGLSLGRCFTFGRTTGIYVASL